MRVQSFSIRYVDETDERATPDPAASAVCRANGDVLGYGLTLARALALGAVTSTDPKHAPFLPTVPVDVKKRVIKRSVLVSLSDTIALPDGDTLPEHVERVLQHIDPPHDGREHGYALFGRRDGQQDADGDVVTWAEVGIGCRFVLSAEPAMLYNVRDPQQWDYFAFVHTHPGGTPPSKGDAYAAHHVLSEVRTCGFAGESLFGTWNMVTRELEVFDPEKPPEDGGGRGEPRSPQIPEPEYEPADKPEDEPEPEEDGEPEDTEDEPEPGKPTGEPNGDVGGGTGPYPRGPYPRVNERGFAF